MVEIISVRFKEGGKHYYFNPNGAQFQPGEGVIVETTRGTEFGECVQGNTPIDEMELTRKWVLKIVGDEWPLQHRHVLGQAIRIRSPYVDALSVTQVLALGSLRKRVDKEELTHGQKENYTYLILCTVSGVAAGLQNTG